MLHVPSCKVFYVWQYDWNSVEENHNVNVLAKDRWMASPSSSHTLMVFHVSQKENDSGEEQQKQLDFLISFIKCSSISTTQQATTTTIPKCKLPPSSGRQRNTNPHRLCFWMIHVSPGKATPPTYLLYDKGDSTETLMWNGPQLRCFVFLQTMQKVGHVAS